MVIGRDNRQDLAVLESEERRRLLDRDVTRGQREAEWAAAAMAPEDAGGGSWLARLAARIRRVFSR